MQGQTVVRIGGRDYLVERTFGGEPAVYVASPELTDNILVSSHIESGRRRQSGTRVIIVARLAEPREEDNEDDDGNGLHLERRHFDERHWEPVTWEAARTALGKEYQDLDLVRRDLEDGKVVDTSFCRYRRVEAAVPQHLREREV